VQQRAHARESAGVLRAECLKLLAARLVPAAAVAPAAVAVGAVADYREPNVVGVLPVVQGIVQWHWLINNDCYFVFDCRKAEFHQKNGLTTRGMGFRAHVDPAGVTTPSPLTNTPFSSPRTASTLPLFQSSVCLKQSA